MIPRRAFLGLGAACLAAALLPGPAWAAGAIAVVTRKGSPFADLADADLKKLFTGGAVAGAGKAKLVDYGVDVPVRDDFYRTVTGRDGRQMHSFWVQFVFSGSGRGPIWVKDAREMTSILKDDEFAIGYMWENEVPAELEVVWRLTPK